jgi:4-carboxymuconolactone decarboxylase
MPQSTPRIAPLPESEWDAETREILQKNPGAGEGRTLNIFATLARHPKLLKRWLVFGSHVLAKSTLPARERELVILRTGFLCRCHYEFHQHSRIGLASGLSAEDLRKVTGPLDGWSGRDLVLLQAADELHARQTISDDTWKELRQSLSDRQLLDLLFAIGQYTLVSMVLNTLGVQIEDGTQSAFE